jgi:alkanesulfonate monooxygenase SsuD/methylene tetrahydromethanopterin reductase-like flavin-dependent oxidoreductase (luciferase family)
MTPAPGSVPVYVGGLSDAAFARAARHDGWISDLHTTDQLAGICRRLRDLRAELGREDQPFAVLASCKDAWDLDGYRRLEEVGVTHLVTQPWLFYGGDTLDLQQRIDGIHRFAEDIIARH